MKRCFSVLFFLFISGYVHHVYAQIITTIAGNGVVGNLGNDGPANFAQIGTSRGVTVDAAGNIYLCDDSYSVIRKITAAGIIHVIAGTSVSGFNGDGGPATAALLNAPYGIALDAAGNVFIADLNNNRVRKIDPAGNITTVAGNGSLVSFGDGGQATNAHVNPVAVAVDGVGNLYIADSYNNRIRKVNTAGVISTIAGNGTSGYGSDGVPATATSLWNPQGVAVDNSGNVYIAELDGNRVRKVSASGIITTIAGNGIPTSTGDGGPATAATVHGPWSVAVDGIGNIYIGHHDDRRVRKINTAGIIRTFAGNGLIGYSGDGWPAPTAKVNEPAGMGFYGPGKVYIADYANAVIRMVYDDTCFFANGHLQHLTACTTTAVNSFLAVHDGDAGQALDWSILTPPSHGTVSVAYTATITSTVTTPIGLSYTPAPGYTGADTFKVRVTDDMLSDTTTICIDVYPPSPGAITGPDSVCVDHTITLTPPVPGGIWSASNGNATVFGTGVVTGVAPGTVIITYSVSNACVTTSNLPKSVYVAAGAVCIGSTAAINGINNSDAGAILVYPNPNTGSFMISSPVRIIVTVSNVYGKQIKAIPIEENATVAIELNEPPGVYFLSAAMADGSWNEKVIVSR